MADSAGYKYHDGDLNQSHSYLLPVVLRELNRIGEKLQPEDRRVFDLGCGNGSIGAVLFNQGWEVTGVDPSGDGIAKANLCHPELQLSIGSAYDDLREIYGQFPVLISLEVVEHLYDPRSYARTAWDLLVPGGTAIVSTPYHGYSKNLALAITGQMDKHFTALWDHGHIKFWSVATLSTLFLEVGFSRPHFSRVGRIGPFAKSMVAVVTKP